MSASDRLGLQNDLFALARAGLIPTSSVLEFVSCYEEEEEYVVWADLLGNLAEVADVLKHTDAYDAFAAFVRQLISRIVQKVGWDKRPTDDHCAALLRARVLVAGVKYGDDSVRVEAEKRFARFMEQKLRANGKEEEKPAATAVLPADIRTAVYSCVVKHGGLQAYETMLQLQSHSELQEEKVRCLHALAAATEPELVQRSIEYSFSDSVRSQDAPSFIAALGSNRKATHALWGWLQQHWQRVIDRFGGTTGLSRIVSIVDNFSDQKQADEVDAFFASHQAPAAQQAVRQAIEKSVHTVEGESGARRDGCRCADLLLAVCLSCCSLKANATYLKRDGDNIKNWLQAHAKAG
jgi:puromycin-sensitive aminopeptidase